MSERPTTPDLVERVRAAVAAASRRDLDTLMSSYAPDAVWALSPMGIGTFEGRGAIHGFAADWLDSYEDFEIALEEIVDLGSGVVFVANLLNARPAGIVRQMSYLDMDEARSAAELLTEDRR